MATNKVIIKDFKLFENKIAEIRSDLHGFTDLPIGAKIKLGGYRGSAIFNAYDLSNGNKITVHLNDINFLPDEEEKEISGTFNRIKSGKVKPDMYGTNPVIVLQEGSTIYLSSALLLLLGVGIGNKISFAGDANKTFIFKDDEEDSLVISKDQTVDSFEVYTALTHMTGGLEIKSFSVSLSSSSFSDMQGVRFYEISPRVITSEPSNIKYTSFKTIYDDELAATLRSMSSDGLDHPYGVSKSARVQSGSIKNSVKPGSINWESIESSTKLEGSSGEVMIEDPTDFE